jgi:hypothetical protein
MMRKLRDMWHDDTAWVTDRKTRNKVALVIAIVMLSSVAFFLISASGNTHSGSAGLLASSAEAGWPYTTWNKGGRHYHRGTWATWDWGLERVTASDRRTYDCTGH